jgi:hypothetical protein
LLFYFSDRVLPIGETYRHGWGKAKIATQSIHIMLCYFNGFVYRLSFCSQGQHFDIFMDNVDMVYMNIMICWNIIMVMCIYFGLPLMFAGNPLSPNRGVQFVQFTKQTNQ